MVFFSKKRVLRETKLYIIFLLCRICPCIIIGVTCTVSPYYTTQVCMKLWTYNVHTCSLHNFCQRKVPWFWKAHVFYVCVLYKTAKNIMAKLQNGENKTADTTKRRIYKTATITNGRTYKMAITTKRQIYKMVTTTKQHIHNGEITKWRIWLKKRLMSSCVYR